MSDLLKYIEYHVVNRKHKIIIITIKTTNNTIQYKCSTSKNENDGGWRFLRSFSHSESGATVAHGWTACLTWDFEKIISAHMLLGCCQNLKKKKIFCYHVKPEFLVQLYFLFLFSQLTNSFMSVCLFAFTVYFVHLWYKSTQIMTTLLLCQKFATSNK